MYLIEVICEGVDHVQLFLDRIKCVAVLHTVMNIRALYKA